MQEQDSSDAGATSGKLEQQQSSDWALAPSDRAAVSERESAANPLPQNALSQEVPYFRSEAPSQLPAVQPALNPFSEGLSAKADNKAEVAASKAAATALPDSESDYNEEYSQGSSAASSSKDSSSKETSRERARPAPPAEPPRSQPQLASVAQAAGRAAATALPDSDEEAEEDLESQASASIAPPVPPRAQAPAQGFGRARRRAAPSEAAESAAPGRRLGRLDSLSASDTDSMEVQSRPEATQVPAAPQPAKEAKPAAMPWSLSNSAAAFGQVTLPSISNAAPAAAATRPAASLFGTTAPSFPQAPSTSNVGTASPAPGSTLSIARQRSGALPAPSFGQPFVPPARQASGALPPFSPSLSKPAQASQNFQPSIYLTNI